MQKRPAHISMRAHIIASSDININELCQLSFINTNEFPTARKPFSPLPKRNFQQYTDGEHFKLIL